MAFSFTYGGLKSSIRTILDRQDITDDQLELGIKSSLKRIQKAVKVPEMEKIVTFTQAGGSDSVAIYSDLLELKHWLIDADYLERKSLDYITALPAQSGLPKYFARVGNTWQFWPVPESDTSMTQVYYTDQTNLTLDADTSDLLVAAFTCVQFGALSLLGELYADERMSTWEQRFQQETQELILEAANREFAGSETSISPPEGSDY